MQNNCALVIHFVVVINVLFLSGVPPPINQATLMRVKQYHEGARWVCLFKEIRHDNASIVAIIRVIHCAIGI